MSNPNPQAYTGKEGVRVSRPIQFDINTRPPVTANGRVIISGAGAVQIQNAGDDPVTINNHFTLPVNGSIEFGTNDDYNYITCEFTFIFAGSGVSPRVEIITMDANIEGYGNMISQ
jgi:hypothetical protein